MSVKSRIKSIEKRLAAVNPGVACCVNYGDGWACPGMPLQVRVPKCPDICPLEQQGKKVLRIKYVYGKVKET